MNKEVLTYSIGTKFWHWLIAFLIIPMLAFSFFIDSLPKANIPTVFMIHKSIGLSILALMIMRLCWINYTGKPALPASVPVWQKALARLVQYSLYFFVILMPLSGWIMSVAANKIPRYFGLFSVPLPGILPNKSLAKFMSETHTVLAWIIISLLVLHILGAIKHHFIDKDNVLINMLPGGS